MRPLSALIREHVTPVANAAGFRRTGRTFWMAGSRLDYVLFGFQVYAVDPVAVVFDVEFHAVPDPYRDWLNRGQQPPGKVPNSSCALMTGRCIPPASVAHSPDGRLPFRTRWALRPGEEATCGRVLAETLSTESLPHIQLLLDRAHLLEVARSRDGYLMKRMTPILREIVLRIDDISAPELAGLLAAAEASGAPPAFAHWARERHAAQKGSRGA
ncbi:hypothetical protein GCM10010215_53400 [Streptomyces virginiae]|uniref:DUF4304 domain-containing protein n=1 Tax=Streptomyces virginiae TaxID=1961 RepID=A0ABQ3NMJ0_STRVG|nr:hypothetical protein GCM10010215_53400 [Streptomyces virginiae]GHI13995.1 hypothetical protein Scinn_34580 [Streptomyces virginiae]